MAYRRCILTMTQHLSHQHHLTPSFSFTSHHHNPTTTNSSMPAPTFRASNYAPSTPLFHRTMFTISFEPGGLLGNVAALSDSYFPVAAMQSVINQLHLTTGLNWWATIAFTTLAIRCSLVPLNVLQLRATARYNALKPKLEEIRREVVRGGMSPEAVSKGRVKVLALYKEYGISRFTAVRGVLVTAPVLVSFYFALLNMSQKVPDFREGGVYWFTDLTVSDQWCVLPVVTACIYYMNVEVYMPDPVEGVNPKFKKMKAICSVFASLSAPLTCGFATAMFCYWIPSSAFSLTYGLLIKRPEVKKFLGILPPPTSGFSPDGPNVSFYDTIKKFRLAEKQSAQKQPAELQSLPASSSAQASKGVDQEMPSSTMLSQRMKSLEKEVNGRRKRGKKWLLDNIQRG